MFPLDTHAGRGSYDLSSPSAEAAAGVVRFCETAHTATELRAYAALLARLRTVLARRHLLPGSPLIAAATLRPQDRAVLNELLGAETEALNDALAALAAAQGDGLRVQVVRGDGFDALRAQLPPRERRGLTFIDPPYEDSEDFARVQNALAEGLRRFPTGVLAAWYPIKEERATNAWLTQCRHALPEAPLLVSELWLYPRDSRVGLNGSGLLIVNAPWLTFERMQVWLPELEKSLAAGAGSGSSVRGLAP